MTLETHSVFHEQRSGEQFMSENGISTVTMLEDKSRACCHVLSLLQAKNPLAVAFTDLFLNLTHCQKYGHLEMEILVPVKTVPKILVCSAVHCQIIMPYDRN